jgi:hypothetical protein
LAACLAAFRAFFAYHDLCFSHGPSCEVRRQTNLEAGQLSWAIRQTGHLKGATVFGRSLLQFVAQDLSTFVDPKHARPSGGAVSGVTVSSGGTVEVVGGIGMPPGVKLSAGAIAQLIHMKTADPACCCCTVTRRPLTDLDDRRRQRRNGHQKL